MNKAMEKMLDGAMEIVLATSIEARTISIRGKRCCKFWAVYAKAKPGETGEKIVKTANPMVEKLRKMSKKVQKDLGKLHDAGTDPQLIASYYDGTEFRDRTKKLLVSSDVFDRSATKVLVFLKNVAFGLIPGTGNPPSADVIATVRALEHFNDHFNNVRVAIRRIR